MVNFFKGFGNSVLMDEYYGSGESEMGGGGSGKSEVNKLPPIVRVGSKESGLEELCKNLNNGDKRNDKVSVMFMSNFNEFLEFAGKNLIGLGIFGLDSGDMRSNAYTTVEKIRKHPELSRNQDLIIIGVKPKTPRVVMDKSEWFQAGGNIYLEADTDKIYFEVLVNSLYGKTLQNRNNFS